MIDIIKKKLIPMLIVFLLMFCIFSKSFAVEETSNYYDVYENMQNDICIARNWVSSYFSNITEFRTYINDTYNISISNRLYFALPDIYNNVTHPSLALCLMSTANYDTTTTFNYYGVSSPGFTTTGTRTLIYFSPNKADDTNKGILTVNNTTSSNTFFAGYYYMKLDTLFTNSPITQSQILDNTDEMNLHLQEQNDFLQNSNTVDDSSISSYTNEIDNSVSSIKDDFDNSDEKTYLTNYFDYLTADNSEEYGSVESIDLSFSAFGRDYNIIIPASLTKDFILNAICHGNVTQRNTIVTIIQSVYGLTFGIFFLKKFYEIFKHIITLNFEGFDTGTDIINML